MALKDLPLTTDPRLLAGIEGSEDAGVYQLTDEIAIIQTVDFFTPIVDDPYTFGQIAAANALSDVYAMGGRPLTALNIVTFPIGKLDIEVLRETLRGGLDKMHEAGVLLVGGHSVDDPEIKYGLAVTGTVHPDRVWHNNRLQAGDALILTKPLGTGIIGTAIKADMVSAEIAQAAIDCMRMLNQQAAEIMQRFEVHAATDVTGFGLIGHACEMVAGTGVSLRLDATRVPLLPGVIELARTGLLPGGLQRNREFRQDMVDVGGSVNKYVADVLFDPQTSGGLLVSLPEADAHAALKMLHNLALQSQ